MKNKTLITVIVPVYKVEKYLNKCVKSIVNQTYKHLEIILVDDGSPDYCPVLCEEWAKSDARIKVIHRNNGGLSAARNSGIDIAKGDYIAFVDSDDYIAPNFIEDLYYSIKDNNSSLSICGIRKVKDSIPVQIIKEYIPNNINVSPYDSLKKLYSRNSIIYTVVWNKLYSKKLFDGIRFDEGRIHEDFYIMHKIFYKCDNISCINNASYYYLVRDNSIISNLRQFDKRNMDAFYAYLNHLSFYRDKNLKVLYNLSLVAALNWCVSAIIKLNNSNILKNEDKLFIKNELKSFLKKNLYNALFYIKTPIYFKFRLILLLFNFVLNNLFRRLIKKYHCKEVYIS